MIKKLMFRQHWQTMLDKCCLNGPVPTGLLLASVLDLGMIALYTTANNFSYTHLANPELEPRKASENKMQISQGRVTESGVICP